MNWQNVVEYLRQFGQFQRNARLYLLSNALSGMTTGIFLVLYNLYLTSLGYKADFVGATLFVGTIGAGVAIFPAGICVDRWSGKWLLIGSSLLIGLVGTGAVLFRQPGPLLMCAFFIGVATAFSLVINAPFLTRNSVPAERPDLFSLNIVLTQITTVLGEVLGGALPVWFAHSSWWMAPLSPWFNWLLASQAESRSYQLAMLVAGLIAIPSFIPLFLLSNDHPQPLQEGQRSAQSQRSWRARLVSARKWARPAYLRALLFSPFLALVLVQPDRFWSRPDHPLFQSVLCAPSQSLVGALWPDRRICQWSDRADYPVRALAGSPPGSRQLDCSDALMQPASAAHDWLYRFSATGGWTLSVARGPDGYVPGRPARFLHGRGRGTPQGDCQ